MPKMLPCSGLSRRPDYYTPRDLADVLGVGERMVLHHLHAWKPERRGQWWRLSAREAISALGYCLSQPQRRREGQPERPRELSLALGLLAAVAAQAGDASTSGGAHAQLRG